MTVQGVLMGQGLLQNTSWGLFKNRTLVAKVRLKFVSSFLQKNKLKQYIPKNSLQKFSTNLESDINNFASKTEKEKKIKLNRIGTQHGNLLYEILDISDIRIMQFWWPKCK